MNTEDRLIKARVQLQRKYPFFSYLSLFLKFKDGEKLPEWAGAGVDEQGNFYYKKKFFDSLSSEEIEAVMVHEILHLSFLHLLRRGSKEFQVWNIACDVVVNQIIKDNGFSLPKDCIISNNNNSVELFGMVIDDCNKKTAEEIYFELMKKAKKKMKGMGDGDGGSGDGKGRFDVHIEGKELTEEEKKELVKTWNSRTNEAMVSAKMKGNIPLGIERLIGELHKEKINWKALLYQFITREIPYNYTWAKPSKKSISVGTYIPDLLKEKVDITIGIDLSGSIGQEELNDFLSEIVGIAKAFQEQIDMRLITHEVDVNDDYEIKNGSIEKIKQLKIKGGGGTSHKTIFDYIKDNVRGCKCVIFFTDGESDIEEIDFGQYPFSKVFVISKNGRAKQWDNCQIIKLDEE